MHKISVSVLLCFCMQKKKGISLIVLVITIIVMLILATTIILAINNNNVVDKAKDAVTEIPIGAFDECTAFRNINYTGSQAEFESIDLDERNNDAFINATKVYNYVAE